MRLLEWKKGDPQGIAQLPPGPALVCDPGAYGAGAFYKPGRVRSVRWVRFRGMQGVVELADLGVEHGARYLVIEDQFVKVTRKSGAKVYAARGSVEGAVAAMIRDITIVRVPPATWQFGMGYSRARWPDTKAFSAEIAAPHLPPYVRIDWTAKHREAACDVNTMAEWFWRLLGVCDTV